MDAKKFVISASKFELSMLKGCEFVIHRDTKISNDNKIPWYHNEIRNSEVLECLVTDQDSDHLIDIVSESPTKSMIQYVDISDIILRNPDDCMFIMDFDADTNTYNWYFISCI